MDAIFVTIIFCAAFVGVIWLVRRMMIGFAYPMDEAYHLVLRKMIKNDGLRCVRAHPRYLVRGKTGYPFLYHLLCAFIPDSVFKKIKGHLSIVVYVVCCVLTMVTLWIAGYLIGIPVFPTAAALVAAVVVLNPENVGRLDFSFLSQFSARPFGRLLCAAYFLLMCLFLYSGAWGWAAGTAVLSGLIVASSIFGFQASIIGSVLLSLFTLSPWPVVLLVAGWILAAIASKGKTVEVMMSNLQHWRLYITRIQHQMFVYNRYKVPKPSHLMELVRLLAGAVLKLKPRNMGKVYEIFRASPLFGVLGFGPFYFVTFYVWGEVGANPAAHPFERLLVLWSITGFVAWLLTMLPWLKSFGEPERYVDFVSFVPSMALLAVFFVRHPMAGWIFMAAYLLYALMWYVLGAFINRHFVRERDAKAGLLEEVVNFMRREGGNVNLFVIPRNLTCYFQYCLDVNAAHNLHALPFEDYDFLIESYPFPPEEMTEIVERFDVTHMIVLKVSLPEGKRFAMKQPRETVFENSDYLVWRCARSRVPAPSLQQRQIQT